MLVLAVDTTAEFGSIALADQDGIRAEVPLHAPAGFSQILFAEIGALLARQGVTLADIDLFAAASGPGSFTGVRVGLAAVKGLAETMGRQVVAVSNLEALASLGESDLRAVVIDARRGEVFAALFDRDGVAAIPEQVIGFPRFLDQLAGLRFEWISSGFEAFVPSITGTPFEQYVVIKAPRGLAGVVAGLALGRDPVDPVGVDANYVRRSDAELLWKE